MRRRASFEKDSGLRVQGNGESGCRLASDTLRARIVERLVGDFAIYPPGEDVDGDLRTGQGVLRRQVGVGDRAPRRVPVAARGHAPDNLSRDPHRLIAESHRARVGERQAGELRAGTAGFGFNEGVAADEPAWLVELHTEAEPALVGRLVRGDVRPPDA